MMQKKKINERTRSIRKKYLSFKVSGTEREEILNKLFKLVIELLQKIVPHKRLSPVKHNRGLSKKGREVINVSRTGNLKHK